MQYVSIYNVQTGERITTYALGIHANTLEELKQKAKKECPNNIYIEQSEEEYKKAINNNLLYIDGGYKNRPELTEEEEKQKQEQQILDSQYEKDKLELGKQYLNALLADDTETQEEIKFELQDLNIEYDKAIKELTEGGETNNA